MRAEPQHICGACEHGIGLADDVDRRIAVLTDALRAIQRIVDEQAKDEGLWFRAQYASEAYPQRELRRLHAVVEATEALR